MSSDEENKLPAKPSFIDWLESLLPFQLPRIPLPQVAKNFDKAAARLITSGFGNLSERLNANTRRIKARSTAEMALIGRAEKALSNDVDLGPTIQDRAMNHALGEAIDSQINRERIFELTANELSRDKEQTTIKDASSEIDDDWLNIFTKHAEGKSNEDIRQIWAKILASEIRKPGSSSLRTLNFLASINSSDANRIARAFSYVVQSELIPTFVQDKEFIAYTELLFLQEVGIITGAMGLGGPALKLTSQSKEKFIQTIRYYSKIAIVAAAKADLALDISVFPLSEVGREIFEISDTKQPDYQFFEDFSKSLQSHGVDEISIADILSTHVNTIRYANAKTIFKKP